MGPPVGGAFGDGGYGQRECLVEVVARADQLRGEFVGGGEFLESVGDGAGEVDEEREVGGNVAP